MEEAVAVVVVVAVVEVVVEAVVVEVEAVVVDPFFLLPLRHLKNHCRDQS
ncbi:MAG: hypothetical protein Q8Q21_00470 [bacterium]|nr:hypothetical protein [bacterium]